MLAFIIVLNVGVFGALLYYIWKCLKQMFKGVI